MLLILAWFLYSLTFGMCTGGKMSIEVSFTVSYCSRHFLIHNTLWALSVGFSILTTVIIFTESLNHQGSEKK